MSASTKVILASGSPRRRQLLGEAGFVFDVIESGIAEGHVGDEPARDYALRMAREKARAVSSRNRTAIVVSADTVVVCDALILEKPASPAHAPRIPSTLSPR